MKYRPKQGHFQFGPRSKNRSKGGCQFMQKWGQIRDITTSDTWRHQMVKGPSTMLKKGPK